MRYIEQIMTYDLASFAAAGLETAQDGGGVQGDSDGANPVVVVPSSQVSR
jgi:hypothetical protein